MSKPLELAVRAALSKVPDPDLGSDLVTLGMVKELDVTEDGQVRVQISLTTPACPMKEKIESDVRQAVLSVPGVTRAHISLTSEVRGSRSSGAGAKKGIEGVAHLIAVSSGKGGVGKSTVAVNLACSLALEGARVGLLDADVYGPNLPTMMGITEQPYVKNHPEKGEIFVPPAAHGVKLMSMGFLLAPDQPVIWRGPMLHNILSQFCTQVEWGTLDYLVLDLPPGTGDVQLSLAQLLPLSGSVLVTTPQEVSLQDVRKAFHMWEKVRVPVLGIVENMSYFTGDDGKRYDLFGQGGGVLLAKKFQVPCLAQLPLVPSVRVGGDEGRPISISDPSSEVAKGFRDLAKRVAQELAIRERQGSAGAHTVEIGAFS